MASATFCAFFFASSSSFSLSAHAAGVLGILKSGTEHLRARDAQLALDEARDLLHLRVRGRRRAELQEVEPLPEVRLHHDLRLEARREDRARDLRLHALVDHLHVRGLRLEARALPVDPREPPRLVVRPRRLDDRDLAAEPLAAVVAEARGLLRVRRDAVADDLVADAAVADDPERRVAELDHGVVRIRLGGPQLLDECGGAALRDLALALVAGARRALDDDLRTSLVDDDLRLAAVRLDGDGEDE